MDNAGWVDGLLDRLTLEQKVMLLSGVDAWRTAALDGENLPSLTMTVLKFSIIASRAEDSQHTLVTVPTISTYS